MTEQNKRIKFKNCEKKQAYNLNFRKSPKTDQTSGYWLSKVSKELDKPLQKEMCKPNFKKMRPIQKCDSLPGENCVANVIDNNK